MSMARDFGHDIPDDDEAFGVYDLPERRESFAEFSRRAELQDIENAEEFKRLNNISKIKKVKR